LYHGDADHVFSGIRKDFIIFRQAPEIAKPCQRSFNYPTDRKNGKGIFTLCGDMQFELQGRLDKLTAVSRYPGSSLALQVFTLCASIKP
jgi:hypothetical protein